jgi:hypothetical protein
MTIDQAVATLRAAGVRVELTAPARRHYSLAEAAELLGVSVAWVRAHLNLFPGAWRLPAGSAATPSGGRNVGELRIPAADLDELVNSRRLRR